LHAVKEDIALKYGGQVSFQWRRILQLNAFGALEKSSKIPVALSIAISTRI
jgi:hypothetical protein